MNKDQALKTIFDHIRKQFPKTCSCCGYSYETLCHYIKNTNRVGKPVSYDAFFKNWQPLKPVGTLALANCRCGSTLAVSSKGMSLPTLWSLLAWARKESKAKNISITELLHEIRNEVNEIACMDLRKMYMSEYLTVGV